MTASNCIPAGKFLLFLPDWGKTYLNWVADDHATHKDGGKYFGLGFKRYDYLNTSFKPAKMVDVPEPNQEGINLIIAVINW